MKFTKKAFIAVVAVLMMLTAFAPAAFAREATPPAEDSCDMFYLGAVHGINGEKLGLERELPVDVYVNGNFAFSFEFKDRVQAKLPAGEYTITVNLADTQTQVMSLGPVEIPGCVKVVVKAKLVNGTPTLIPSIRELPMYKAGFSR
jgi:hypothetical protein